MVLSRMRTDVLDEVELVEHEHLAVALDGADRLASSRLMRVGLGRGSTHLPLDDDQVRVAFGSASWRAPSRGRRRRRSWLSTSAANARARSRFPLPWGPDQEVGVHRGPGGRLQLGDRPSAARRPSPTDPPRGSGLAERDALGRGLGRRLLGRLLRGLLGRLLGRGLLRRLLGGLLRGLLRRPSWSS